MFKYKFVAIVNTDLEMGKGKIAGQVGHAVADLMWRLVRTSEEGNDMIKEWYKTEQVKIVLKTNNYDLEAIRDELMETAGEIIFGEVNDLGLTQITKGARTVLWLFGRTEDVDKYISHLKLL